MFFQVGDFQDGSDRDLNGFFVQEEDVDSDLDPTTSEGIFVFDGNSPAVDVALFDKVKVTGEVAEFNGKTEIVNPTVEVVSSGNLDAVTVASLILPLSDADLESYEGMLVIFPQELFVTELFNLGRYGEAIAAPGSSNFPVHERKRPKHQRSCRTQG